MPDHLPLMVTAYLAGPVSLPAFPWALDALLMWAASVLRGLEPPAQASDATGLDIPVPLSECGRYYLASFGVYDVEQSDSRWLNQRFPLQEAQLMGNNKLRRIQLSAGRTKSYRIPYETAWLVDDRVTWWCYGDRGRIDELLSLVGYLGRKRAVGLGKVARWEVNSCDQWDGFPVVDSHGRALRTLPADICVDGDLSHGVLLPPYWDATREEPVIAPCGGHT